MRRFLALGLVLGLPFSAQAGTIHVPEDYPTVLAGEDAAVAGDSVLVGPGTWTETAIRATAIGTIEAAMFLRPGITVIGTAGADQTVVDAGERTGPFLFAAGYFVTGSDPARLIGLTMTSSWGGVAPVESGPLEIYGCNLIDCGNRAVVATETSVLMVDCLVANNEFEQEPGLRLGAVSGQGNVDFVARDCRFENNASSGVRIQDSLSGVPTVVVEDCEFVENGNRALLSLSASSTLVERCFFQRNSGGGVGVSAGPGAIRFCTFAYDSAASSGGGIFTTASAVVIENNTFYRCYAPSRGGAINRSSVDGGTRNNVVYGCTGPYGPFYLTGTGTQHPTTGCNLFFANEGSGYAGNWSAGPTDVFADPEFCDEMLLDFRLRSSSPGAPEHNPCGLVGAHEVGCGPVSVERTSWGRIKGAYRVREGR